MHRLSSPRQADIPTFRIRAVRQDDDLIDRTALAGVRGDANALIDARSVAPHSPAVIQDELSIGDLLHHTNVIILEDVFSFPESSRDSDLISHTDLHRRGNE